MSTKKTIKINEEFKCQKCGTKNPLASGTCRNHCINCLFSLHVDEKLPGDRASTCHGLMEPISVRTNNKKGWQIEHECQKCGYKSMNKVADDDDRDALTKVMQRQNMDLSS